MKLKTLLISALALSAVAAANAADITVAGTTTGTFSATGTNVYNTLTYNSGTFNDTTSGGFAGIGGVAGDNFGTLTLAPTAGTTDNYSGTFALQITFTAPSGISGGNTATYTATVMGSVTGTSGGAALISFSPNPQTFTFNDGTTAGSFQLTINNVAVTPGQTASITGQITGATTVPDGGATVALLGAAFVGLAAVRAKLRSA